MFLHHRHIRMLTGLLMFALALLMSAQAGALSGAAPSSDPLFEFLASTGGTVRAVATDGSYAYLTEGNALTILDVRAPAQLRRLGQIPLPGCMSDVQVVGQLAYVFMADAYCLEPQSLQIVDVTDRNNPTLRYVADGAVAVQVVGRFAYLVGNDGLQIVDVSNPAHLLPLGHYTPTGDSALNQVQVVDTHAYALSYSGLQIINVRDPHDPTLLGSYLTSETLSMFQVVGNLVYAVGVQGLKIIDVSSPTSPILRGSYRLPGLAVWLQVVDTIVYVTFGSFGVPYQFLLFDVRDPAHPALRNFTNASAEIHAVQVVANKAYISAFDTNSSNPVSGFSIVDVSDPDTLIPLAGYRIDGEVRDMDFLGGLAYLAVDSRGLQIIDVHDAPSSAHVLGSYVVAQTPGFVEVIDGLAYVSDGIRIFDIRDPAEPVLRGSFGTPSWRTDIRDVQVANGMAYVTSVSKPGIDSQIGQLSMIDVTNPTAPVLRGGYSVIGQVISTQMVGGVAFIAAGLAGFQIVDVSDPATPVLLGTYTAAGPISHVQVRGNLAYVVQDSTLLIIDVQDRTHPTLAGTYTVTGPISSLQLQQSQAYLVWNSVQTSGHLEILDLNNPIAPALLGSYAIPSAAAPIYSPARLHRIVNGRAYLINDGYFKGSSWGDLTIVDVNDPTAPRLLGTYAAGGRINSLQVVGDLVYLGYLSLAQVSFSGRFTIINLGTLPTLTPYSTYTMPSGIFADVEGNLAYIAARDNGLRVLRLHTELLPITATITPAGGSLTTYDGGLSLSVPAGAVTSTTLITYTGQLLPTHPMSPKRGVVRSFTIAAQTSTGLPLTQLAQPATLVLSYTDALVTDTMISDERTLNLMAWNGQAWTDLLPCNSCTLDSQNNRVTVTTNMLTEFVLVGDRHAYFLPLIVRR
jgi:hypothetical protein